ncbi:MAG: 2-amino-4-hydroxy-6-hydroxymethyldihydropteridine diphosphokinase [Pseudomonadota bacterium]
MPEYLVALGSNQPTSLGGAEATLAKATECIISGYALYVKSISRFYRTPAFPDESDPEFVNAALRLQTESSPHDLLATLHAIEEHFGRDRRQRWGPRTLDLDLLLADDLVLPNASQVRTWMGKSSDNGTIDAPPHLTIPHPRLHERAFVLGPAQDIAPNWTHPILGKTLADLWNALPDSERSALKALP